MIVFKAVDNSPHIYNLGFGDVEMTGEVNDMVVTDNNDRKKVLATVALAVGKFFEQYPTCYVYAVGSNKARTRLYRMGISNSLGIIVNDFEVFGFVEKRWEVFRKDTNYEAFLIKRKGTIFAV